MAYPELHHEKELLRQVATGDAGAFGMLYKHYYAQLRPHIWKSTDSATATEEILQETFIKVWLHRDILPGINHFRGWIFKIASNEYLLFIRRKLKYEAKLEILADSSEQECSPASPYEISHVRQIKKLIGEAVRQMPPQRRTIYEMSRNEGLKIEEIAGHLSITTRTVKNVLSEALRSIRAYLIEAGHEKLVIVCLLLQLI